MKFDYLLTASALLNLSFFFLTMFMLGYGFTLKLSLCDFVLVLMSIKLLDIEIGIHNAEKMEKLRECSNNGV